MKSTVLGVALATVVVYLWGFLYWGAATLPYNAWNETSDDVAAGQALLEHFPESGVYYIPANGNDPELRSKLYDQGPTGFVILDVDGRPEFDSSIMATGFALNGVVLIFVAILLRACRPALPSYVDRVKFCALVAAIAVVFVNFGDAVWWALPWHWELVQAFYNFTALLLGGAIVSRFVQADHEAS